MIFVIISFLIYLKACVCKLLVLDKNTWKMYLHNHFKQVNNTILFQTDLFDS